jgi:hypothetical protein
LGGHIWYVGLNKRQYTIIYGEILLKFDFSSETSIRFPAGLLNIKHLKSDLGVRAVPHRAIDLGVATASQPATDDPGADPDR